jgi:hypothetical protein
LKLKSCAEDLKLNPCHQATSTESNPKTTQSGGTKVTVSGLELESEQELSHGKTTRLSASTSKTILSGNGSLDTPTNGSILIGDRAGDVMVVKGQVICRNHEFGTLWRWSGQNKNWVQI